MPFQDATSTLRSWSTCTSYLDTAKSAGCRVHHDHIQQQAAPAGTRGRFARSNGVKEKRKKKERAVCCHEGSRSRTLRLLCGDSLCGRVKQSATARYEDRGRHETRSSVPDCAQTVNVPHHVADKRIDAIPEEVVVRWFQVRSRTMPERALLGTGRSQSQTAGAAATPRSPARAVRSSAGTTGLSLRELACVEPPHLQQSSDFSTHARLHGDHPCP